VLQDLLQHAAFLYSRLSDVVQEAATASLFPVPSLLISMMSPSRPAVTVPPRTTYGAANHTLETMVVETDAMREKVRAAEASAFARVRAAVDRADAVVARMKTQV
jgi:hypothetical protein